MAAVFYSAGLAGCLLGLAASLWLGWFRSTEPETTNSTFTLQDAKDAVLQDILSGKVEIPLKSGAPTFTLQEVKDYVLQELLSGNIEIAPKGESQSEALSYFTLQEKTDIEEMLKEFCLSELREQVARQSRQYEEQLQTLKREFEDKLLAVQEQCETNISNINSTVLRSLDDARTHLAAKQRDLDDVLKTQPLNLENQGFMNIETFGPILVAVAVVEVMLVMCVCGLLCPAAGRRGGRDVGTGPGQLQGGAVTPQSHSDSRKQKAFEQRGKILFQEPRETLLR